jgi:type II secretory pathway component PulF
MPHFRYQALDVNQQRSDGTIEADTVQQAIEFLEARDLIVQSIGYAAPDSQMADVTQNGPGHAAGQAAAEQGGIELAVLRSHMARVLEHSQAITPPLLAYAEEMPAGRRRSQLSAVCRVLERGDVDEATATFKTLPEYWIPLLSAATSSRDPERVLREFLAESHRADDIRQQWWLTLAYPVIVICVAAGVLTALSYFVIPLFAAIFVGFDLVLPTLTMAVLMSAHWLANGGAVVVVAIVVVLGSLFMYSRLWLPWPAGSWFGRPFGRATSIARLAQFIADLLEAGLDIPNALRIAGFTTRRTRLRTAAWRLANDFETGQGSTQPIRRHPLTATVLYALGTEMAAPSRIHLLREISDCYAGRVRLRLSWTHGIIEPISICLVGLFVGLVVLALFLPLVRLVTGLSG